MSLTRAAFLIALLIVVVSAAISFGEYRATSILVALTALGLVRFTGRSS